MSALVAMEPHPFYYEGTTQHSVRRNAVVRAIRPGTTTMECISNRVLAASTPLPSQSLAHHLALASHRR